MPELPEVETIRRDLEGMILHQTIKGVQIHDHYVIRDIATECFVKNSCGKTIISISRRGKAIILTLFPEGYIVIQLMMTGQLIGSPSLMANEVSKHRKVTFLLSNGCCLTYNDQRRFGRITFVDDLDKMKFLKVIGPEPLEEAFNPQFIAQTIKNRRAPIKSLLLNQHFVAGIGNIYASEILFESRINPKRRAKTLKSEEIECLHKTMMDVLKKAIQARGTSMRNYLDGRGARGKFINRIKVYGREHEACVICQTPITRIVQAGRSTFYCRKCQK